MADDTKATKQEGVPMMPPPAVRKLQEETVSNSDLTAEGEKPQVQQTINGAQESHKGRRLSSRGHDVFFPVKGFLFQCTI